MTDLPETVAAHLKGVNAFDVDAALAPFAEDAYVNDARREPIAASEIVLGLNCGGSDGSSGITANAALGVASDRLVACGGTVILGETTEIYGAEQLLTRRARTSGSPACTATCPSTTTIPTSGRRTTRSSAAPSDLPRWMSSFHRRCTGTSLPDASLNWFRRTVIGSLVRKRMPLSDWASTGTASTTDSPPIASDVRRVRPPANPLFYNGPAGCPEAESGFWRPGRRCSSAPQSQTTGRRAARFRFRRAG